MGRGVLAVVTGGSGFLGRRIVELLVARGDAVRVVARGSRPGLEVSGATWVAADIRDRIAMRRACDGADVVFHVAGRTGYWGARWAYWSTNVEGTRVVLEAARNAGVSRLVYTGTPSAVGYHRDVENGDRDLPYARRHLSAYAASKCAAERCVLDANSADLTTIALRPHLIIGPGDAQMMPRVIRQAARGRLRIIGDGRNRVDLTYVDNAAWAHLDAADALLGPCTPCAGRSYFISNDHPVELWTWLNQVLTALELPRVTRTLPHAAAHALGSGMELLWNTLPISGEPPITRFLASALARSHWYDMGPAKRDLGYRVRVPMEEATGRTVRWLRDAGLAP